MTLRTLALLALALGFALPGRASASLIINTTFFQGIEPDEADAIGAAVATWESLVTDLDGDPATEESLDVTFVKQPTRGIGFNFGLPEDSAGRPTGSIISFDDGTNFTFFVDPTPFTNEEFVLVPGTPTTYAIFRDPARFEVVDLYTTMLHELGHMMGFSSELSPWEAATDIATETLSYGDSTIGLFGNASGNQLSHLSGIDAPYDLMLSGLSFTGPAGPSRGAQGTRRLVTSLDLDILEGIYGYTVDRSALQVIPEPGSLVLVALGIAGIGVRRRVGVATR